MSSPKSVGRRVGLLLFVHLAAGLTTPYMLLRPLAVSDDFVATAAPLSFRVRLAVLMLFVGGAVTIGISVAALPVFRRYSNATALWLLALAVANFSLQCVENAAWLSMLSLSQQYAGAADAGLVQGLAAVVRSAWKWAHYTHLLVVVAWMFLLFALLFRFALVPRAPAAAGMLTALLQISCITLPQFLGYGSIMPTATGSPLGVSYLALILWLLIKGLDERARPPASEARTAELAGA